MQPKSLFKKSWHKNSLFQICLNHLQDYDDDDFEDDEDGDEEKASLDVQVSEKCCFAYQTVFFYLHTAKNLDLLYC